MSLVPNLGSDVQGAFVGRLKMLLPPWFGDGETPILDGVLAGPAAVLTFVYHLLQYVVLQVRIATATDGFLDLVSADFFGGALPRQAGEMDAAFSTRIRANFFASRNTKPALIAALTALGATVRVFEPWNPADMGALGQPSTLAYNVAGLRGSYTMTGQCFVIVTLPAGSTVTPSQVYAAVESVRPLAIKVWTKIVSA